MPKKNRPKITVRVGEFFLITAALYLFFIARIPEMSGFRILIAAVGFVIAAAAAVRTSWGLAAYVLFLLTANNWPYLFGSQHNTTYPPVAAVLFVFLAAGWSLRRVIAPPGGEKPAEYGGSVPETIGRPLAVVAIIVAVSAAITIWRWLDFYPLRGTGVFDWMTNSNGLPAHGACWSAGISALSYLLPFAMFGLIAGTVKNRRGLDPALRAASLGLGGAALFGFFQYLAAPGLGNTDFWVFLGQINATFKDPNAFGGVLAILLPVMLGIALDGFQKTGEPRRKWAWPAVATAAFILGIFVIPWTGARSALLALGAGLAVFAAVAFRFRTKKKGSTTALAGKDRRTKRLVVVAALILALAGGSVLVLRSRLGERLTSSIRRAAATGDFLQLSPERYFLWKHALAMIRDYPIAGVGVGAYIVELPDYYARDKTPVPAAYEGLQRLDSAENYFLHAAAELGLAGLAVLLTVFAGLFLEIRRGIKGGVLRRRDRWVYLGAVGGLAGFVVNALFHSFAQSFETLFCFWFAAAVLVVLGRRPDEDGGNSRMADQLPGRSRSRRSAAIFAVVIILVFGGAHLWNSSRSLSLAGKSAAFGISQEYGLYRSERDESGHSFRWTRKDAAWSVEIKGRVLRLPVSIMHPDSAVRPVRVRVSLGKSLLREVSFLGETEWTGPGRKILEFVVPPEYSGPGMIRITVDRTWIPSESLDSKDSRNLGAAVEPAEFFN